MRSPRPVRTSLLLASLALLLLAGPALAGRPIGGCPPGPTDTGTADIGAFVLWDASTFAAATAAAGGDPGVIPGVYAQFDKNLDGNLCVQVQVLPNDASGNDTWFVPMDNTFRAP